MATLAKKMLSKIKVYHADMDRIREAYMKPLGETSLTEDDKLLSESAGHLLETPNLDRLDAGERALATKPVARRKGIAANDLFEKGFYLPVAEVEVESLQEAVDLTTSRNSIWYLIEDKRLKPLRKITERDTGMYDIVEEKDGSRALVMPLGFIDLSTGKWL